MTNLQIISIFGPTVTPIAVIVVIIWLQNRGINIT